MANADHLLLALGVGALLAVILVGAVLQQPPPPPPLPPPTAGSIEVCVTNEYSAPVQVEIRYELENEGGTNTWGPAVLNPGEGLCTTLEDLSLKDWRVWAVLVDESGLLTGLCHFLVVHLTESTPHGELSCTWP